MELSNFGLPRKVKERMIRDLSDLKISYFVDKQILAIIKSHKKA